MTRHTQLLCIHAMGIYLVLLGGGFIIADWIPPPSPEMSVREITEVFRVGNAGNVRIAVAMIFFGAPFLVLPSVVIANQMRRIEGPTSTLAWVQMLMAVCGVFAAQIPAAMWLAISYRGDVSEYLVVTLNDIAWFFFLCAVSPLALQIASVGCCILQGEGTIYPRWLGYFSLWMAMAELPAALIPFFKNGLLAWDGLLGFWFVVIAFFAWAPLMWFHTVRAINKASDIDMVCA